MTMARSLATQNPIHFDFSKLEEDPETPTLKFYNVMLHKIGGRWNEFYIGHVVSHLSIQDWCDMKGMKLVQLHAGTRWAKPHERTDLF
jgi:hypothetical protein